MNPDEPCVLEAQGSAIALLLYVVDILVNSNCIPLLGSVKVQLSDRWKTV